jgi:tetratricopeptide (TPR) repeat protein
MTDRSAPRPPVAPGLRRLSPRAALGGALCLLLVACNDGGERAERFFQSGLELREAGDLDRAAIQFRNVFQHDGAHREARLNLAEIQMEQGDYTRAFRQYLRLAEQHPQDVPVRIALASLAAEGNQWDEVRRHVDAAREVDPDDPGLDSLEVALAYYDATVAEDAAARAEAAGAARALLEERPDELVALRIVIADLAASETPEAALAPLERAAALRPDVLEYPMATLRLLAAQGEDAATEAHLRGMVERFPENQDILRMLGAWYLQRDDVDGAIGVARRIAGPDTGRTDGHLEVIRLLAQLRGRAEADAEIDRLIAANAEERGNLAFWRMLRAGRSVESGDVEAGIAELREVIAADPPPPATEELRAKATLAELLRAQGQDEEAMALVEEVLSRDSNHVAALTVRGAMRIDGDRPDEAIADLRRALSREPRSTAILTLMAQAHLRAGDPELAGEQLAAAVEASGSGVAESLRYAQFLIQRDRAAAARAVLQDAREANPGDVDLLVGLARLGLEEDALPSVQQYASELGAQDGVPRAEMAARSIEAVMLLREQRFSEAADAMTEQALALEGDARAVLAAVRTRLAAGEVERARSFLDGLRAERPEDLDLQLIDAVLSFAEGEAAEAEGLLRDVIDRMPDGPAAVEAVRVLHALLLSRGEAAEADALLDRSLEAQPESRFLRLLRAAELERGNDIEGAIAIYEALYEEDTSDTLIANNLASLLSAHRDDEESLRRAAVVAQRLRGTEIAPFQDTYGWIAHRRGAYEEALRYLEPAVEGLPQDPLVRYHLGMTYHALGRAEQAEATLRRAVALAGDSPLPQFDAAREIVAELEAGAAAGAETGGATGAETDAGGAPADR